MNTRLTAALREAGRNSAARALAEECAAHLKVNPEERGTARLAAALQAGRPPAPPLISVRAEPAPDLVSRGRGR